MTERNEATGISGLDIARAILLLVAATAQMFVAYLPELLDWSVSISTRAREYETLLSPAGPAFAIWGPLFLGCFAFAVWHGFPAQLRNPLTARIGWLALAAFCGNAVWALHQPLFGPGFVSFFILIAIATPLLIAIAALNAAQRDGGMRSAKAIAYAPLFALAGWITIASAAGFSLALNFSGLNPLGLADVPGAVILLAVWAAIALPLAWRNRSFFYAAPIAWGLFWIYVANSGRRETMLAYLAAALAALILATAAGGKIATR